MGIREMLNLCVGVQGLYVVFVSCMSFLAHSSGLQASMLYVQENAWNGVKPYRTAMNAKGNTDNMGGAISGGGLVKACFLSS